MSQDHFATRARLIEDAFESGLREGKEGSVPLASLVRLMRQRSREYPFLSSLYFAGAEKDHPYFLQNEKIAVGIAVLPEDAAKAGRWRRHPHQTEVMFVLEGEMVVEFRDSASLMQHRLTAGNVLSIPPGTCHRVLSIENAQAAYLFAKSEPVVEPRAEDC